MLGQIIHSLSFKIIYIVISLLNLDLKREGLGHPSKSATVTPSWWFFKNLEIGLITDGKSGA